jgi:hypothetical protein
MKQTTHKPAAARVRYYRALEPCIRLGVLAGDIVRVEDFKVQVMHSIVANPEDLVAALEAGVFRLMDAESSRPAMPAEPRMPAVRRTASGRTLKVIAGGAQ